MASSRFSALISPSYLAMVARLTAPEPPPSRDTFLLTRVFTFIMRVAKRSVATLSSTCWASGHTHAIMRVRQFPPRLSFSMLVSLLER